MTVFEQLHSLERSAAGDELMAEVRLVRLALVDFVTLLARFLYTQDKRMLAPS